MVNESDLASIDYPAPYTSSDFCKAFLIPEDFE